jgi:hypothetical protein
MIVIGLSGRKGCGKDTCADYLVSKYGFVKLAFADTLKDLCKTVFGFNNEQLYGNLKEQIDPFWEHSPREIMQTVGTELFRNTLPIYLKNLNENIWIRILEKKIKHHLENGNTKIIITDIRAHNELQFVKQIEGIVWKITRKDDNRNEYSNHSSETLVDELNFDKLILNDSSIMDFYSIIDKLICTYNNE